MENEKLSLEYREDGVYITASDGADYSMSSVVGYLKTQGVENYDGDSVTAFVSQKDGAPAKIAERDPEQEKDADLEAKISSDGMKAELWIDPPFAGKPWPDLEQILNFLASQGIVEGINKDAIAGILAEKKGREWNLIASGTPAADGKDADIDYKVQFGSSRPMEEDESGRVDLKSLSSITIVIKNQLLAEKIPLTEGVDGITVKGAVIKAKKGRDAHLPTGAGTEASEDGLRLHSIIDGNLVLKGGKLHVVPVFEVDGDVDYSVGNIDFIGSVIVNGAVREGFSILSSGDIEVRGVVEGARLESRADIIITGGIRGMNKAEIKAEGDISAGFIDQAHVRSDKSINVNNAVLHSNLAAHDTITVLGGQKAQVAGGKIHAGLEVVCLTLGSEMGTKTEVVVGVLPELAERKKNLVALLAETEEKGEKVEVNLAFLKKLEGSGQIDDNKRALMINLTKAKFQLQSQTSEAKKELEQIESQMDSSKNKGRVRVKGVCYPGVTVTIRGVTYIVREKQQFCSFIYENGEVKVMPFDH